MFCLSGFCLLALFIPVINFASYVTCELLRQVPVTGIEGFVIKAEAK